MRVEKLSMRPLRYEGVRLGVCCDLSGHRSRIVWGPRSHPALRARVVLLPGVRGLLPDRDGLRDGL